MGGRGGGGCEVWERYSIRWAFGDGELEKIRSVGISGVGNGRLLRGYVTGWMRPEWAGTAAL